MGGICSASQPNSKSHVVKVIGKKVDPEAMEKKYVRGSDVEAVETPDDLLDFFEEIARGEKWDRKTKEELKKKLWPGKVVDMDMKLTKIPSVDQVFDAAAEPSKKVIQMRDDLETAISTVRIETRRLAKVGKKLTNLSDALELLLATAAGAFTLEVSLEPPEVDVIIGKDCKGEVYDALKGLKKLSDCLQRVVEDAPAIAKAVQQILEKAKAAAGTVKSDAEQAGLNPFDTAKAVQVTTVNVQKLVRFMEVITDLLALAKGVMKDLAEIKKRVSS